MRPGPTIASFALAAILAIGGGSPGARADAAPAVRCQDLLDYLKADADGRGGRVLRWGHPGPLVRVVAGSPDTAKEDASYVVWLINKELPPDWQLTFSKIPAKREAKFEWGIIKVIYLRREKWPEEVGHRKALARAVTLPDKSGMILAAGVLLDHTRIPRERDRIYTLLHEVLHALGRGHVARREFPETIMHPKASRNHLASLRSLDKAALRAIHSPLVPVGTRGDDLRCDSRGRIRNGQ